MGETPSRDAGSIVSMLRREVFVNEAESTVRFYLFRVYGLEQRVTVRCSTVEGGTAVAGLHYNRTIAEVSFGVGVALAHFEVALNNDERWECVRDFSSEIQEVIEGPGMLGDLVCTVCHIVDDDIYPVEVKRTHRQPRKIDEYMFPSSVHSQFFLTPEEIGDIQLIWGFLRTCFKDTWPFSMWGAIWSCYRGAYNVAMTLVAVILIDYVWMSEALLATLESDIEQLNRELDVRLWTATVLTVASIVATLTHCKTETWVIQNAKYGAITSSLRTNILTQLLYADDGRLSLLKTSEYLNIATNEVESAAKCYGELFPGIERCAHFVLELAKIFFFMPAAAPVILALIPLTFVYQRWRAPGARQLLDVRQQREREYVSTLSDVIDNAQTFRSLPGGRQTIRQVFVDHASGFAKAHLSAMCYNVETKERIELLQGLMLSGIFLASCVVVNYGHMSPGVAMSIIISFLSGTKDLLEISRITLQMKFHLEGIRSMARVLNFPTDAQRLESEAVANQHLVQKLMKIDLVHSGWVYCKLGTRAWPPMGSHGSGTLLGPGPLLNAAQAHEGMGSGNGGGEGAAGVDSDVAWMELYAGGWLKFYSRAQPEVHGGDPTRPKPMRSKDGDVTHEPPPNHAGDADPVLAVPLACIEAFALEDDDSLSTQKLLGQSHHYRVLSRSTFLARDHVAGGGVGRGKGKLAALPASGSRGRVGVDGRFYFVLIPKLNLGVSMMESGLVCACDTAAQRDKWVRELAVKSLLKSSGRLSSTSSPKVPGSAGLQASGLPVGAGQGEEGNGEGTGGEGDGGYELAKIPIFVGGNTAELDLRKVHVSGNKAAVAGLTDAELLSRCETSALPAASPHADSTSPPQPLPPPPPHAFPEQPPRSRAAASPRAKASPSHLHASSPAGRSPRWSLPHSPRARDGESPQSQSGSLLRHRSGSPLVSGLDWLNSVVLKDTAFRSPSQQKMFALALTGDCVVASSSSSSAEAERGRGDFNDVADAEQDELEGFSAPLIRFNARFSLGGMRVLEEQGVAQGAEEDPVELDVVLRLLCGTILPHKTHHGYLYSPPFLRYAYVSEVPVLLEGSVLKNLMLGVEAGTSHGRSLTKADAWEIARRCGLPSIFVNSPEAFNVGRGGRNLPCAAQQAICIARAILSDPHVLLLNRPLVHLPRCQRQQVLKVLSQFCSLGGVWGILNAHDRQQAGKVAGGVNSSGSGSFGTRSSPAEWRFTAAGRMRAGSVLHMEIQKRELASADEDEDQQISFEEFRRMKQHEGLGEEEVRRLFDALDRDRDGLLDQEEVLTAGPYTVIMTAEADDEASREAADVIPVHVTRERQTEPILKASVVVSARDLQSCDAFSGLADPYLVFLQQGCEVGRTPVIRRSLAPDWGSATLKLYQGCDFLTVQCWDNDTLTDDDIIGEAQVPSVAPVALPKQSFP